MLLGGFRVGRAHLGSADGSINKQLQRQLRVLDNFNLTDAVYKFRSDHPDMDI